MLRHVVDQILVQVVGTGSAEGHPLLFHILEGIPIMIPGIGSAEGPGWQFDKKYFGLKNHLKKLKIIYTKKKPVFFQAKSHAKNVY